MKDINDNTPLSFLTLGDLKALISELVGAVSKKEEERKEAHSIAELAVALGCGRSTAQKLKNTVLHPIVAQVPGSKVFSIDINEAKEVLRNENNIRKRYGA